MRLIMAKRSCPWRIRLAAWFECACGIALASLGCVTATAYLGYITPKDGPPDAPWALFGVSFVLSPFAAILTLDGRRYWRNVTGLFLALKIIYLHLPLVVEMSYLGRQGILILDETFLEGFLLVEGVTCASILSAVALFATREAQSYFGQIRDKSAGQIRDTNRLW